MCGRLGNGRTAKTKRERVHLRLDAMSTRKLKCAPACEETTAGRFVLHNAVAAAERRSHSARRGPGRSSGTDVAANDLFVGYDRRATAPTSMMRV